MIISEGRGLPTQPWKELYQAAISEPDLDKLPERLSAVEAALVARARELFYTTGDDGEEGESLDYAMCIVQALRESLRHRNPDKTPSIPKAVNFGNLHGLPHIPAKRSSQNSPNDCPQRLSSA